MPIAAVMTFNGATLEQYNEALADMGFTPGGVAAPGALFHWSTALEGGLRVTEVWESQELFEAFARDQLGPAAAKAGITDPPEMAVYAVHNFLTTPR
jgi:hypothetical protein